jgi:hypothetical protein
MADLDPQCTFNDGNFVPRWLIRFNLLLKIALQKMFKGLLVVAVHFQIDSIGFP